ncbi:MAG TPA: UDP-N-acetylglucosamine 2-epimerase (non-hydrolyzing) [Stellaceae bacterium]|jgi:UDP-N-acetylglucosamine 2-epimerase (non-hydrolysing)
MKIATVLGTRPEIIRLSLIIDKLDRLTHHTVIHTGQNFDPMLSEVFFRELGVRAPDRYLAAGGGLAQQVGQILAGCEQAFEEDRPDRLLILGDTNSGLAAYIAKRRGIPVFHLEAGNRCHDDRVPEEVNRRVIDHCSDILMPYTECSRDNLLREGIASRQIFVTGNPIGEVIEHFRPRIEASDVLERLEVEDRHYVLVTLHRAENVDVAKRLHGFVDALERVGREHQLPVLVSTHPHTRARLAQSQQPAAPGGVRFLEPFGFFDFIHLELSARLVMSDSGTVQEECALLGVPNVTLRDVTERPETIECGSNILSGGDVEGVLRTTRLALSLPPRWTPPAEYRAPAVSDTVVRIVAGYHHGLGAFRG